MLKLHRLIAPVLIATCATSAPAADRYKTEALKEAPPSEVAAAIRQELAPEGVRIMTADGKAYADIWLRKAIPAKAQPGGPEGPVQLPFLTVGELLGVARYAVEAHDYRDQTVLPGVYTIRFGLHPINGDHLGVSPYRDYGLLLPAEKDKTTEIVGGKQLEQESSEAAGTSHPAVVMLTAAAGTQGAAAIRHDEAKDFWGVVLPLSLKVAGSDDAASSAAEFVFDAVGAQ